jgi:hypothetical protein
MHRIRRYRSAAEWFAAMDECALKYGESESYHSQGSVFLDGVLAMGTWCAYWDRPVKNRPIV